MGAYIQTSAGPLHWRDYGGSGEVILLVHGLGGSVANWDAVGPRLSDLGRTVALDLPGFGLSPPARDWELHTHARAVHSFMSEFAPSATLIGNSMGVSLLKWLPLELPRPSTPSYSLHLPLPRGFQIRGFTGPPQDVWLCRQRRELAG
ncbi:MAG: alpha/beta fold hydrolase [Actinobacteria bacterium]|nr:alpha/beta fold hydrolase [Actinomycetota bacterium]